MCTISSRTSWVLSPLTWLDPDDAPLQSPGAAKDYITARGVNPAIKFVIQTRISTFGHLYVVPVHESVISDCHGVRAVQVTLILTRGSNSTK